MPELPAGLRSRLPSFDVPELPDWLRSKLPGAVPSSSPTVHAVEEPQAGDGPGLAAAPPPVKPEDLAVVEQLFKEALAPAVEEAHQVATATSEKLAAVTAEGRKSAQASKAKASFPGMDDEVAKAIKHLEDTHETLQVMRESIVDSGPNISMKGRSAELKQAVHSRLYHKRLASGNDGDELVLHSTGVLGLSEDISSSQLVQKAAALGLGPASERAAVDAAHRQALADVETFKGILHQIEEYHHRTLTDEASDTAQWAQKARDYLQMAEETVERMASLLEEQRRSAEAVLRDSLDTQKLELGVAHTSEANTERVERQNAIDGLRDRVNALSRAFAARSDELRASSAAHHICATLASMSGALADGRPIGAEVARLRHECGDDAFVAAVLDSLPPAAATRGVSSERTLLQAWPAVKRAVAVSAALPAQGAGIVSTAVANLAAWLKINERGVLSSDMPAATLDSKLALVEKQLLEGRLADATVQLERIAEESTAGRSAEEWLAAARARIVANQAVAALNAHATVLRVSTAR